MSLYGTRSDDEKNLRIPLIHRMDKKNTNLKSWEFPGWGTHTSLVVREDDLIPIRKRIDIKTHKLSEWPATAICGNDILSSCLYVSGLVASKAGKLAPIALALVAGVLYLYRYIYGEVVSCVPMNGGSYNVLLNTTTKRIASFAASLAILSYIATGVVSGTSACTYLATIVPSISIVPSTIGLLLFFAILSFIGITESSVFALIIFIIHTSSIIFLSIFSIIFIFRHPNIIHENFLSDFPDINMAGHWIKGNGCTALFFGLATAMLGISGFETSSQFVEEQADGVFTKTLRNMWWGVAIINPLLSLLSLGVMPLSGPNSIIEHKNTVIASMANVVGGRYLELWISLDAFIVLSGAVLTAYVGIVGLSRRLAGDRILPNFLLYQNEWRKTNHYIIFLYFLISASLVCLLHGDVETLSGVYTYAFLGLMMFFASGCMLLKFKRAELPRTVIAPWWTCFLAIIMVVIGFLGNLLGDPTILTYFALYFIIVLLVVYIMFERIFILRACLYLLQRICPSDKSIKEKDGSDKILDNGSTGAKGGRTIIRFIKEINMPPILFFCKKCHLPTINKAILYVKTNEQTSNLIIVHVYDKEKGLSPDFAETVAMFDCIYSKIKVDFMSIEGQFGPALIEWVSENFNIPKNMMFIKQPDQKFAYKIDSLGGVRVITG